MNNILESEIPKHRKKTNSTISKSREKAKHKHQYTKKCIIKYPTPYLIPLNGKDYSLCITTYCEHCGKVGDIMKAYREEHINESSKCVKKFMTDDEIIEYYKDLDIIEVEDRFVKYIPITINK